jgi:hypothetical protein
MDEIKAIRIECGLGDCKGAFERPVGWLQDLATEGMVWPCPECGQHQFVRVALPEARVRLVIGPRPPLP